MNGGNVEYHFKGNDNQLKKTLGAVNSGLGSLGKGLIKTFAGVTAGVGAMATGITALGKSALTSFARNEQLVGGVDTLFKESSKKLQQYADEAYKTAGVSANDYMEISTDFSARLLQSLGGDTDKAVEFANKAIIDMSDNANKMGTNIESIKYAYKGFAKQNYMMLDNLKLGYGGTRTEMERLLKDAQKISGIEYNIENFNDVIDAIHVIQTELDITGTTQKEAMATIEGSMKMAKSAWNNFITGIGRDNTNFDKIVDNLIESITAVGNNIIPRIKTITDNISKALPKLLNSLLPVIQKELPTIANMIIPSIVTTANTLLETLTEALISMLPTLMKIVPQLIDTATKIYQSIMTALINLLPSLANILPQLVTSFIGIIQALSTQIINMLPTLLTNIQNAIIQIIPMFVTILPQLLNTFLQIAGEIAMGLVEIIPDLIPQIVEAILGIIDTLLDNIDLVIDVGIEILLALVDGIIQSVPVLLEKAPEIIRKLVEAIIRNLPKLFQAGGQVIGSLVGGLIRAIPQVIKAGGKLISTIGSFLAKLPGMALKSAVNMISGLVKGISNGFGKVGQAMRNLASNAMAKFKQKFGIHSPSTVMFKLGGYVDEGFINGVEDMQNDVDKALTGMFDLSPNLYNNASTHFSPSINVNVVNNMEQDPLGIIVNKIKTLSGGSKNDYNYGMGVA